MRNPISKTGITIIVTAIASVMTPATSAQTKPNDIRTEIETVEGNRMNHYDSFEAYVNAGTTESVRNDKFRDKAPEDKNTIFVIYGIDMSSIGFANGDFLWAGGLAKSSHSDYDYDGLSLPITGAVIVFRKSTISMLCPEADSYVIDGKESTKEQFDALKPENIQCVTIQGRRLLVKTRFLPEGQNADVAKANDDEGHLMRRMFADKH